MMNQNGRDPIAAASAAAAAAAESLPEPPPLAAVDPHAVDNLLSHELQKLSFQDRVALQEEIHGVGTACPDETPELLRESLQQMRHELDLIAVKPAYDQAQLESVASRSFVTRNDVWLIFLRCELFDASRAAARFVTYLDVSLDTFGSVALERFVRWEDLGDAAQEFVRSGKVVLLPYRDRSGRRVIVWTDLLMGVPFDVKVRAVLYLYSVVMEDVESQRKGVVHVVWPLDGAKASPPDIREFTATQGLFRAFPVRNCSFHFCSGHDGPTNLFRLARAILLLTLGENNRRRQVFHIGERTEIRYKLMGYGIPSDLLPFTETGTVKREHSQQWARLRQFKEYIDDHCIQPTMATGPGPEPPIVVDCPLSSDVIFRSGKSNMCHPGNVMFRGLLETYYEQHRTAQQDEKRRITWKIVDEVLVQRSGRFLVWEGKVRQKYENNIAVVNQIDESGVTGWWTTLTDRDNIRCKVAISLRDERKRVVAIKNQQRTSCSTRHFLLEMPRPYVPPRNVVRQKRKRDDAQHVAGGGSAGGDEDDDSEGMCFSLSGIFSPSAKDPL